MGSLETFISLNLTINIIRGKVTSEELLDWVSVYYEGIITKFVLLDFNEADLSNVISEEFGKMAKEIKKKSAVRAGGKTALVCKRDFGFGLGRMFQVLSEIEGSSIEYKIFRSRAEAKKWLGV